MSEEKIDYEVRARVSYKTYKALKEYCYRNGYSMSAFTRACLHLGLRRKGML